MSFETLLYEVKDGVAVISLNRPDRMNSLGGSMKADLQSAIFDLARNDESVRSVIITGVGDRAFCAGADIKERAGQQSHPADYYVRQKATHQLFRNIEEFEKPIIAAINGVALGGGLEIALCCDIRIASATARFGLPEGKIGVIPAAGGTQRLPRIVGVGVAKELIFTSEIIDAQRAFDIRLVNHVVEPQKLMPAAFEMAAKIARNAPLALRFAKQSINLGIEVGIEAGLEFERYAAAMVTDSDDRKEGMRSFVEKRAPVFKGR
ncbi:MAG: enoyl-CoA hydratase-related protein [Rhizobacter sp.]